MYDKIQIENGKLVVFAKSDLGNNVQEVPLSKLNLEKILTGNKIEYYEQKIEQNNQDKIKYRDRFRMNLRIARLSKVITGLIIAVLVTSGFYFMPLTPLVTNLGMLAFVGTVVTGGVVINKAEKNKDQLCAKLSEINKVNGYLKAELINLSNYQNLLNSEPRHIALKDDEKDNLEESYNEELKRQLLMYKEEVLAFQRLAKQEVQDEHHYKLTHDCFDIPKQRVKK